MVITSLVDVCQANQGAYMLIFISWGLDTFSLDLTLLNVPGSVNQNMSYAFSDTGITWSTDKNKYGPTTSSPSNIVPPPSWQKRYPNGYNASNLFDPSKDEHFQVWMRTSWFPTFRKLYAKYTSGDPLLAGTYQISVDLSKYYSLRFLPDVSTILILYIKIMICESMAVRNRW
jgi:hypothetical protein